MNRTMSLAVAGYQLKLDGVTQRQGRFSARLIAHSPSRSTARRCA